MPNCVQAGLQAYSMICIILRTGRLCYMASDRVPTPEGAHPSCLACFTREPCDVEQRFVRFQMCVRGPRLANARRIMHRSAELWLPESHVGHMDSEPNQASRCKIVFRHPGLIRIPSSREHNCQKLSEKLRKVLEDAGPAGIGAAAHSIAFDATHQSLS